MLPRAIAFRTFHIGWNGDAGTAFTIDVNNRQYLVTAKHVLEGFSGTQSIEIYANKNWVSLSVELVGHSEVDVSVLAASQLLTDPSMKVETASADEYFIGQQAFFVGFPLGLQGGDTDSPFPVPLLKSAIISGPLLLTANLRLILMDITIRVSQVRQFM